MKNAGVQYMLMKLTPIIESSTILRLDDQWETATMIEGQEFFLALDKYGTPAKKNKHAHRLCYAIVETVTIDTIYYKYHPGPTKNDWAITSYPMSDPPVTFSIPKK